MSWVLLGIGIIVVTALWGTVIDMLSDREVRADVRAAWREWRNQR